MRQDVGQAAAGSLNVGTMPKIDYPEAVEPGFWRVRRPPDARAHQPEVVVADAFRLHRHGLVAVLVPRVVRASAAARVPLFDLVLGNTSSAIPRVAGDVAPGQSGTGVPARHPGIVGLAMPDARDGPRPLPLRRLPYDPASPGDSATVNPRARSAAQAVRPSPQDSGPEPEHARLPHPTPQRRLAGLGVEGSQHSP